MQRLIKKAKAGQHGFTLVELMIVVAIVGVLAVLAVYGVRKYIANAKTAEARNALGQISKDAATAYERESMAVSGIITQGSTSGVLRQLCAAASSSVPAAIASVKGAKYQSSPGDWNADQSTAGKGFACLKYSMDQPQYYMYTYTASNVASTSGGAFSAIANGDLNGDGTPSTFALAGTVLNAVLNIAPTVQETNPEE